MKKELNSIEIKKEINFVIKRNVELAEEGKMPISIEIEGMPGTAKTSVVKQVAQEHDYHFVRLNLAECEPADLIGLPVYEYEIKKGANIKWVSDKVLAAFVNDGWDPTGEHRTSYSKPHWIHGKEDKPIILTLDDYNRC
jgi:Cdc6-like AAA superfamily ATPase